MAPKKRAASKKKKSTTDEQTLVNTAALEQQKERLRNEEYELRQRLYEEEKRILDECYIREMETRFAISDQSRKKAYEQRERDMEDAITARDREIHDLKVSVATLEQKQKLLESSNESLERRAEMLSAELKLAGDKRVETETLMETQDLRHREAVSSLEKQYDELQASLRTVQADRADVQKKLDALTEEHSALTQRVEKSRDLVKLRSALANPDASAEPPAEMAYDDQTMALLRQLEQENVALQAKVASLNDDLDRKKNDEEKARMLVNVVNGQLNGLRDENKRIHNTAQSRESELAALKQVMECDREKFMKEREEHEATASHAAVKQHQLQLEVDVHRKQVETLSSRLDGLQKDHSALQMEHTEYVDRVTKREQEDFQTNVSMKAELEKQKNDLAELHAQKVTAVEELANQKLINRAEQESFKRRITALEEAIKKKDADAHEVTTVLRAEIDKLLHERTLIQTTLETERELFKAERDALRDDRDSLRIRLEETTTRAVAMERDLTQALAHVTAKLDAKTEEHNRLSEQWEKKEEALQSIMISLRTERESLLQKVSDLQIAGVRMQNEHKEKVEKLETEFKEFRWQATQERVAVEDDRKAEKDRANFAERNVKRLLEQVHEKDDDATMTRLKHSDAVKALKAELQDTQSELAIARRTIERLEVAVGDQSSFVQLTEYNEKLKTELEKQRYRNTELQDTVKSLRSEQSIMAGYGLQKLKEENERLARRITQQQHILELTLPLFIELRGMAERNSMPPSLRESLSNYDAEASQASTSHHEDAVMLTKTLPAVKAPAPPMMRRDSGNKTTAALRKLISLVPNADGTTGTAAAPVAEPLPAI